jgi:hypothetical protein
MSFSMDGEVSDTFRAGADPARAALLDHHHLARGRAPYITVELYVDTPGENGQDGVPFVVDVNARTTAPAARQGPPKDERSPKSLRRRSGRSARQTDDRRS